MQTRTRVDVLALLHELLHIVLPHVEDAGSHGLVDGLGREGLAHGDQRDLALVAPCGGAGRGNALPDAVEIVRNAHRLLPLFAFVSFVCGRAHARKKPCRRHAAKGRGTAARGLFPGKAPGQEGPDGRRCHAHGASPSDRKAPPDEKPPQQPRWKGWDLTAGKALPSKAGLPGEKSRKALSKASVTL